MSCLAHTEAVIDFGDDDRENDVDDATMWTLTPRVEILRAQLIAHLADGRKGEMVREGVRVVLAGPPNAGKSSLLNALAKRPAAIVSPIAGTTRDLIEVRMDLGGFPCIVSDTAGLYHNDQDFHVIEPIGKRKNHNEQDIIEMEGMRRAKDALRNAHIRVLVADGTNENSIQIAHQLLNIGDKFTNKREEIKDNAELEKQHHQQTLMVLNKIDLSPPLYSTALTSATSVMIQHCENVGGKTLQEKLSEKEEGQKVIPHLNSWGPHYVSCTTGEGIEGLEGALIRSIQFLFSDDLNHMSHDNNKSNSVREGAMVTRERHRRHVRQCVRHLDAFLDASLPMDAAAEELRLAALELGKVTGR